MRNFRAIVAAFLLFGAAPVVGDEPATPSGPRDLLGSWSADCDAWGTPARCTLVWSEGLHVSQMTVAYRIEAHSDGAAIFAGKGVYRALADNALDGYWYDAGGATHPLAATWDAGALTTHWGIAGSKQGRTRYRLTDAGRLEVTDWLLGEDAWRQFMGVTYDRDE